MNSSIPDKRWFPEKSKEIKNNDWLLSYLDVFILLLAFFLILASRANDLQLFLFDGTDGTGYRSITQGEERVLTPIWELKHDLESDLSFEISSGLVELQPYYNEIRLQFTDAQFYASGSAQLLDEGKAIIERIMRSLADLKLYEYYIDVEGHTDDQPIQTVRFPSNWELSTARASTIIRYFLDQGFPPERLKASGYAEMHPIAPNKDEFGEPIKDNMALNRRIVIRIFYELGSISPFEYSLENVD